MCATVLGTNRDFTLQPGLTTTVLAERDRSRTIGDIVVAVRIIAVIGIVVSVISAVTV